MEQTNFRDFIKKYCVRIPKIQREYVQGQNERGFSFIDDIFEHIKEEKAISLDLIYGSIQQGNDEKDIFEPIDGQQRLTTLFLLYWYFRHVNGNSKVDDIKFIYETRESSKEFCEAICKNKILLNKEIVPSELLTNEPWFYEKYRYDYTIKSMIKMLDYIQNVYCNSEHQITLKDLDDYIIFNVHIFKNYTLGNSQYIIMNDRGKQLNAFENFKSAFSKWLNTDNSANNVLEFNKNMDGKWSEELWNDLGRDSVKTDNLIYIFFIRFIWCMYVAIPENKNDEYEKIREKLNESVNLKKNGKRKNVVNEIDFKKYIKPSLEKITKCRNESKNELIEEMTNYLNFLFAFKDVNAKRLKDEFLKSPWNGKQEEQEEKKDIDSIISEKDFAFKSRVANYGLQLFFEKNDYTKITEEDNAYKEWKRFVWNIIEDSNLDNVENTISALRILNKYRLHVNIINEKLSEQNEEGCNITERREIRKAKYIKNVIKEDEDWRKIFDDAEHHQYLKGYIDFLIIGNDKKEEIVDTKDEFTKRKNNMDFIFSDNGLNTDDDHLVLRALLSKYTFKYNSKGKLIIPDIRIFDSESDRGVLKTSIKEEWTEYIKEYLAMPDKKAIIEQMKTDISSCGLQYSEDEKKDNKFIKWQIELCNNEKLMNFIIEVSIIKNSSYATPMHFASSSRGDKIRVYYEKIHNSNTQLWLDTDYAWCVEELEKQGFQYKNILPGEFEEKNNYRFEGKDKDGNDLILCFGRSVIVYEKDNIEITIHPTKEIKYNNRKDNTFNYLKINKEKFVKFINGDETWNN